MAKECPHCHLVSPTHATVCDCGYGFDSGQLDATPRPRRARGPLLRGWEKALVGGCALTVLALGAAIVWLLAFAFGQESIALAAEPLTIGRDWTVLSRDASLACARTSCELQLRFRGDDAARARERFLDGHPELAIVDEQGVEHPLDTPTSTSSQHDVGLHYSLRGSEPCPKVRSVKLRGAEPSRVDEVLWVCADRK